MLGWVLFMVAPICVLALLLYPLFVWFLDMWPCHYTLTRHIKIIKIIAVWLLIAATGVGCAELHKYIKPNCGIYKLIEKDK